MVLQSAANMFPKDCETDGNCGKGERLLYGYMILQFAVFGKLQMWRSPSVWHVLLCSLGFEECRPDRLVVAIL